MTTSTFCVWAFGSLPQVGLTVDAGTVPESVQAIDGVVVPPLVSSSPPPHPTAASSATQKPARNNLLAIIGLLIIVTLLESYGQLWPNDSMNRWKSDRSTQAPGFPVP